MLKTSRHRHKELIKVINNKLRADCDMFIDCPVTNIDYWYHILSLHYPDKNVEKTKEGVRVS